ncbi:MAG TPA: YbjQ family protein [Candidatus Obscuribacterales bacterium]
MKAIALFMALSMAIFPCKPAWAQVDESELRHDSIPERGGLPPTPLEGVPGAPSQPVYNSVPPANGQFGGAYGSQNPNPGLTQYGGAAVNATPRPPIAPPMVVVTTTMGLDGYRIVSYKGIVEGVVVRQPNFSQNFAAGFQKTFGGGNLDAYSKLAEQSRIQAYEALIQRARVMGANAVLNVRFDSETFWIDRERFATEVACYGTAVVVEPIR